MTASAVNSALATMSTIIIIGSVLGCGVNEPSIGVVLKTGVRNDRGHGDDCNSQGGRHLETVAYASMQLGIITLVQLSLIALRRAFQFLATLPKNRARNDRGPGRIP